MRVFRSDSRAILPTRANARDAGLDIYALGDVKVEPGQIVTVPTGIHITLDDAPGSTGLTGLFWDKSGRASHGLTILGGCIDNGYRGELKVIVTNLNLKNMLVAVSLMHSESNKFIIEDSIKAALADIIHIPYGKALTQLLVVNLSYPVVKEVSVLEWSLLENTERGHKGFGSSDKDK